MIVYEEVDSTTTRLMQEVIGLHHRDLKEHNVIVKAMFGIDDDNGQALQCLTEGGYPVFGYVKITDLKRRSEGGPDVILWLDKAEWEAANIDQKRGMLDTLLERVTVRTNDKGQALTDSAKRPKLNKRKYDLRMSGFRAVVERNGNNSIEARAYAVIQPSFAQLGLFDGWELPKMKESPKKKKGNGKSTDNPTADMTDAEKDAYVKQNLDAQAAKGRPKSWATEREELIQAIDKKLKSGKLEASTKNRAIIELNIIKDGEKTIDEADGDGLIKYRTRLDNISLKDLKQMFKAAK